MDRTAEKHAFRNYHSSAACCRARRNRLRHRLGAIFFPAFDRAEFQNVEVPLGKLRSDDAIQNPGLLIGAKRGNRQTERDKIATLHRKCVHRSKFVLNIRFTSF